MASIQAAQSLCTFLLGVSIGLAYDIYRLLLPVKPRQKRRLLYDSLWWLLITLWTFIGLYKITWAELRFTILIFLLFGIAVYLYYFSPVMKKFLSIIINIIKRLFDIIFRLLARIFTILIWPIVWLSGCIYKILAIFGVFGQRCGKTTQKLGRKTGRQLKKHLPKRRAKTQADSDDNDIDNDKNIG